MSRNDDELVEDMCGQRIDAWMTARGWTYERTTTEEEQVAGIDAWLTLDGQRRAVDEKAKYKDRLQRCNQFHMDPPFGMAFEVNRVCRNGERMPGWFCASNIKTELYLFAFPAFVNMWDLSRGVKEGMKMWLFPKRQVEKLAAQHGLEKDTLDARAKDMLERGETTLRAGPLKLQASSRYDEAPVNLVVPTPLLRGLKGFQEFTA